MYICTYTYVPHALSPVNSRRVLLRCSTLTSYARTPARKPTPNMSKKTYQTGGADQRVLKRREPSGFAIVNETKCIFFPWDTHYL